MTQNESFAEHEPNGNNRGIPPLRSGATLDWMWGCLLEKEPGEAPWLLGRAENAGKRTDVIRDTGPSKVYGHLLFPVDTSEFLHLV